jgi:uncharacterized protein with HEPN domain
VSERDELYLEHVLQALALIERFTAGGRAAFFGDEMVQSAVIRQLEIVGEAVRNLSSDLKARETMVPWRDIAGTRDRLIHGYFSVKLDVVWNVVVQELPSLKQHVRRILGHS